MSIYPPGRLERALSRATTRRNSILPAEDECHPEAYDDPEHTRSRARIIPSLPEHKIGGLSVEDHTLVVDWDGPGDPNNPKNWSYQKRWAATLVISSFTFVSPLSSSMIAPATPQISSQFGIHSTVVEAMITSIFVLAFAIGPLVISPMSEIFGRVIVLQIANAFFLVWNLSCGFAQSTTQLIIFRFLAGLGGSAPLSVGGAALGDMWKAEERGRAIAIYSLAPLLGPVVGPLIGSWIAQFSTWRWVFWSLSILDVVILMSGLFFLRETFAPLILERKAEEVRKKLQTEHHPQSPAPSNDTHTYRHYYPNVFHFGEKNKQARSSTSSLGSYEGTPIENVKTAYEGEHRRWRNIILKAMTRPFALFFREPIVQCLALYMAFTYGVFYLFLTTITLAFQGQYHMSVGISGLNYIGLGVGLTAASQINARAMDHIYKRLKKKKGGARPEFRLPSMVPGSIFLPVGLILTGWTTQKHVFWLVPDIGLAFCGAGIILIFQSSQTYVIDTFTLYAASALAAVNFFRSLAGFGFPLFAPQMYRALGFGVGNTILAGVAIVFGIPAPWLLMIYGARLRAASKYSKKT